MKKKYRIAFTGVFDLENFGDQLFPIVFLYEMKKRGLNIELILFSPFAGKQVYDTGNEVFTLEDLEKMHLEDPFDAIVVGGGEIIHFFQTGPKLPSGESKSYPISHIWIIPSLIAYKYNIKLIWNCPGTSSFRFDGTYKWMIQSFISSIDYLSVRNRTSREILIDCGISPEKIKVYPDTAFLVSDIVPQTDLEEIKNKLIPLKNKYIVFHTNINIPEDEIKATIVLLNKINKTGYEIVLLPLALTHADDQILKKINILSNNSFYLIDRRLSIKEMISVLACSTLYIGASFHGAVTSMAYGKKAIAYDFSKNKKSVDIFQDLNIEKYCIHESNKLNYAIDEILSDETVVDLSKTKNRLKEHFDNIYELIIANVITVKKIEPFIKGYLNSLDSIRMYTGNNSEIEEARKYIESLHESIKINEEAIVYQKELIDLREKGLLEQSQYIAYQENEVKVKDELIRVKEEEIKFKEEEIKAREEELRVITNTLTWRMRNKIINLTGKNK